MVLVGEILGGVGPAPALMMVENPAADGAGDDIFVVHGPTVPISRNRSQHGDVMAINLYFDIDGVLSPYAQRPTDSDDLWHDYEDPHFLVTTSPTMIARINGILRDYEVTPFWLTSWEEQASWFGEKVGLVGSEQWEWLPAVSASSAMGEWQKFESIRRHVEETNPDLAVWMEDDLIADPEPREWAAAHPRVEALIPNPGVGLSPRQLSRLEELIRTAATR